MKRTKRIMGIILIASIVILLASCTFFKGQKKDNNPVNSNSNSQFNDNTVTNTDTQNNSSENSGSGLNGQESKDGEFVQLLQSASIDLDGDGANEQIKAVQAEIKGKSSKDTIELEGRLIITDKNKNTEIPFIKKQKEFTDVMTKLEFKDLDGDGVKDVFVIIPDSGASFSLNYFFIYNYKTGSSYSYTTDSSLTDFAESFKFKYKGKGLLGIINDNYKLSAVFNISDDIAFDKNADNDDFYSNSWVEPTPVEISENSRVTLVNEQKGLTEIKVPLPVFGNATVDMIGEIDLFYRVNSNFQPVLKRFEVIDFNNGENKKIASIKM